MRLSEVRPKTYLQHLGGVLGWFFQFAFCFKVLKHTKQLLVDLLQQK